jgi:hypothetical protein
MYNLSTLYSQYVSSPIGEVNYFTQVLPTSSTNVGYQEITEVFTPKLGDLIRFYNHDSSKYPFNLDFEREIIKIIPPQGPIGSGSSGTGSYENRLVLEVLGDDVPNISCINNNSLPGQIGKILTLQSKIKNNLLQGAKERKDATEEILDMTGSYARKARGENIKPVKKIDDIEKEANDKLNRIYKKLEKNTLENILYVDRPIKYFLDISYKNIRRTHIPYNIYIYIWYNFKINTEVFLRL